MNFPWYVAEAGSEMCSWGLTNRRASVPAHFRKSSKHSQKETQTLFFFTSSVIVADIRVFWLCISNKTPAY